MANVLLLLLALSAFAHTDGDELRMRVSWVSLLGDYVLGSGVQGKKISSKEIDSSYDCLYLGWPSRMKDGICQSPEEINPSYRVDQCRGQEFLCETSLFGKDLCVSRESSVLSECTKKRKDFRHLEKLTAEEGSSLRQLSSLAFDACENDQTEICKKIRENFRYAIRAINKAEIKPSAVKMGLHKLGSVRFQEVSSEITARAQEEELYEVIRQEFLSSSFCDPLKVISSPKERLPAPLAALAIDELKELDKLGPSDRAAFIASFHQRWTLGEKTIQNLNDLKGDSDVARMKLLILKDLNSKNNFGQALIADAKSFLGSKNIFRMTADGRAECPFIGKSAFLLGIRGRLNVIKQFSRQLTKQNLLSIVDYTRPSNERRFFVFDLNKKIVLHNTWVAHGGGGGPETGGKDGLGSSPDMSNKPGSNKSSEGFILAERTSTGAKYGPNIILEGIDVNNSNLKIRSVILHGWTSPMEDYSKGLESFNFDTWTYSPPEDVLSVLMNTDQVTASDEVIGKVIKKMHLITRVDSYLSSTEGCLGVPVTYAQVVDRKKREKSQLELLREDLPGSLIFNYSGPQMKSKFF